jgi:hypothetical protein
VSIGVRAYVALIAFAPRWVVRCLPTRWRHAQLRRWMTEQEAHK